jgi:hypothetical protein
MHTRARSACRQEVPITGHPQTSHPAGREGAPHPTASYGRHQGPLPQAPPRLASVYLRTPGAPQGGGAAQGTSGSPRPVPVARRGDPRCARSSPRLRPPPLPPHHHGSRGPLNPHLPEIPHPTPTWRGTVPPRSAPPRTLRSAAPGCSAQRRVSARAAPPRGGAKEAPPTAGAPTTPTALGTCGPPHPPSPGLPPAHVEAELEARGARLGSCKLGSQNPRPAIRAAATGT